jgi:hypothetical protein
MTFIVTVTKKRQEKEEKYGKDMKLKNYFPYEANERPKNSVPPWFLHLSKLNVWTQEQDNPQLFWRF